MMQIKYAWNDRKPQLNFNYVSRVDILVQLLCTEKNIFSIQTNYSFIIRPNNYSFD